MTHTWIIILLFVPALALAARVIVSRDPKWQRTIGAVLVMMIIAIFALARSSPSTVAPMETWFGLFGAAVVYLFFWVVRSRDPIGHRVGSAGAAIAGALPIFVLYTFYTE